MVPFVSDDNDDDYSYYRYYFVSNFFSGPWDCNVSVLGDLWSNG